MARRHGTTPRRAAGVIAALSPMQQWDVNLRMADAVLAGLEVKGLTGNIRKAEAIASGAKAPLQVLSGPKVRAFYRAIVGDRESAVVDRHMWRAMGDDPLRPPAYEVGARAITEAARSVGAPVADFQAVVWEHVRGPEAARKDGAAW